ncbi:MAG TPA: sigma-70 family RNA polymerase sigma factor [Steroidobacteraceae bacterium]|nr:sigma-70 family RNA polymerase sigma factor [Steroidobacteraceae bacterium]
MQNQETSFADLSLRVRAGDKQAEDLLSRRIAPGITQILVGMTGNFALAQELCQETLIIIISRLRTQPLDEPDKLPAFVAQIARNLVAADRRKEQRRKTDVDSEAIDQVADHSLGQEHDAQRESAAMAIRKVLAEMKSVRDRSLLVRYYLRDEDKKDICRELGLTEPSFNVILFRARSRFLELLEKRGLSGEDLFFLTFLAVFATQHWWS